MISLVVTSGGDLEGGEEVAVLARTWSCVVRCGTPGIIGSTG
ncbi:hypothetical protein [Streptomyces sp. ISL-44]